MTKTQMLAKLDTSTWLNWERPTQPYEVQFINYDKKTITHSFDAQELELATKIANEIANDPRCTNLTFIEYSPLRQSVQGAYHGADNYFNISVDIETDSIRDGYVIIHSEVLRGGSIVVPVGHVTYLV